MLALEGLIVPNKNMLIKRGVAPVIAHESSFALNLRSVDMLHKAFV